MPNLIINADDFGLSEGVSKAIQVCGQVFEHLSTSVMTCVPRGRELVGRYLKDFKGSVGLHLQLSEGTPILHDITFVDGDPPDIMGLLSGLKVPVDAAVQSEWRAQITKLTSWGITPTHIDSHQNVHSHPYLWPNYTVIAQEFGLSARGGSLDLTRSLRKLGVRTCDVSVRFWRLEPTLDALCAQLAAYERESDAFAVEVIAHPGLTEPTDPPVKSAERRRREFNLFSDPRTYARLIDLGWKAVRHDAIRSGA
jgi:predicted glycoside hydrolase/deacetylase ChbG (UPF0249 family)